jgi:hypothetical protein
MKPASISSRCAGMLAGANSAAVQMVNKRVSPSKKKCKI